MGKNIILIGMPGCGKSTIGVLLAKRLGYKFIDTDLLIQEKEGKRLFEIIRDSGSEYFLKTENEVNLSINVNSAVIATGGSAVYCREAMEHFKKIGKVIYIRVPLKSLKERIRDFETRGILIRGNESFDEIYSERCPLYEKYADVIIDTDEESIFNNSIKIEKAL